MKLPTPLPLTVSLLLALVRRRNILVQLFEGQKNWHCRVHPTEAFELFTTNNPKVDVKFTASHFLGSRLDRDKRSFEGGIFTVFVKDLAEQQVYKVTIQRFVETALGSQRVRSEVMGVENVQ